MMKGASDVQTITSSKLLHPAALTFTRIKWTSSNHNMHHFIVHINAVSSLFSTGTLVMEGKKHFFLPKKPNVGGTVV